LPQTLDHGLVLLECLRGLPMDVMVFGGRECRMAQNASNDEGVLGVVAGDGGRRPRLRRIYRFASVVRPSGPMRRILARFLAT
jgi:hypothetical protein